MYMYEIVSTNVFESCLTCEIAVDRATSTTESGPSKVWCKPREKKESGALSNCTTFLMRCPPTSFRALISRMSRAAQKRRTCSVTSCPSRRRAFAWLFIRSRGVGGWWSGASRRQAKLWKAHSRLYRSRSRRSETRSLLSTL